MVEKTILLRYMSTNRIDVCQEICLFQKQTAQILIKATDLLIKCSVVISVCLFAYLVPKITMTSCYIEQQLITLNFGCYHWLTWACFLNQQMLNS